MSLDISFLAHIMPDTGRTLRPSVIAATGRRNNTQVDLLWITRLFRRISAVPTNSERLDASVFTSDARVEHALVEQLTLFSNASIVLEDAGTSN